MTKSASKLSLRARLVLLAGATLLPILALLFFYVLPLSEQRLLTSKRESTRIAVELDFGVLSDFHSKALSGQLTTEQAQGQAREALRKLRYNSTEYFWINDQTPRMVMHPAKPELEGKEVGATKDPTGKALFIEMVEVTRARGEGFVDYLWPKPGSAAPVDKTSYVRLFKPWGWIVGNGVYIDDVQAQFREFRNRILYGMGLAFAFAALTAWIFSARLTRAIGAVISQIQGASSTLASASRELSGAGEQLSSNATQSAASFEQTTASIEQLSQLSGRTAENAEGAGRISEESLGIAARAEKEIGSLIQAMNEISASSRKIEEINKVIDDIAFQTNLLALNAAVEAARAGEHGKGFAVVAEAVRSLAQRSSVAAREINTLIQSSSQKTENGSRIASGSNGILSQLVQSVRQVSSLIRDMSSAMKEQSRGIRQISLAMKEVDHATQSNAAAAEEIASLSEELSTQSESLDRQVRRLDREIHGDPGGSPQATPEASPSISGSIVPIRKAA